MLSAFAFSLCEKNRYRYLHLYFIFFCQIKNETSQFITRADGPSSTEEFVAEFPPSASCKLSSGDLARLQPVSREGGRRAFPVGWDDVIVKYVKTVNPYCVFSCDQNRVKKVNSRKKKAPFFRGSMKCTFPGCSVCAILTILNEKSDRLDISFSGSLRHKGNIHHGRRVKGIERENFKKELSGAHPSRLHHRLLASLPEKVYASGNRDGVGTQHTLQKISSEKNLRGRPFVDSVQSLAHLRAQFIKDDQLRFPQYLQKESGPHLFGYIQSISLYPTVVIMWTEADLRLYCELCRSGTTFFDATGKLARKVFKDTGPILYYSLVISHPTTKKPPIAVAEMFSSSHSVPTLTSFLMNFRRDVLRLCQGRPTTPSHLEIDLSWASLHSCLRGLYDESLESYFDRSWRIANYEAKGNDLYKGIVHFCTSHLMNTVGRKLSRM